MIKFRCPHCNQKMGVPDDYANRRIRCSKCNEPSRVPALANPVPADATSESPGQTATVSRTQTRINTEEFFAEGKQDSVNIQMETPSKPPDPTGEITDIEDLEMVEDTPRLEALREARKLRQQQTQPRASARKTKTRGRKQKTESDKGEGFQLSVLIDCIPDVLRLPLGLVAALAATGAMIAVWIVASRATSCALGFIALFVPLAGAAGLRLFAVEKTFLWGLLATAIGALGIAAGKAAIAKYVVIPYCHDQVNKEVLVDLKSLLADEQYQLPQGQSAKFIAQDGDFMLCIALVSLVDDGLADPIAARKWALYTLLASNKTNPYAYLASVLGSGPDAPPEPEMEGEDEAMLDLAYSRLGQWMDEELELRKARQYFAAVNYISGQANLQRVLEKPDTALKFAFLDTLGIFDALWVLLGMGLAYISLAMD
ncbi:MAG: zinc ribbon domain-containing protein [Planctomycetota bacterium]